MTRERATNVVSRTTWLCARIYLLEN